MISHVIDSADAKHRTFWGLRSSLTGLGGIEESVAPKGFLLFWSRFCGCASRKDEIAALAGGERARSLRVSAGLLRRSSVKRWRGLKPLSIERADNRSTQQVSSPAATTKPIPDPQGGLANGPVWAAPKKHRYANSEGAMTSWCNSKVSRVGLTPRLGSVRSCKAESLQRDAKTIPYSHGVGGGLAVIPST